LGETPTLLYVARASCPEPCRIYFSQADHAGAGIVGAALGFQNRKNVGVDAFGIVALCLALGEGGLLELGGEESFLRGK
jgi:hypothetical protein